MEKTKYFVFDTNTLISAFILRHSTAFQALVHSRQFGKLIFSHNTFLEFETVLFRKKFDRYLTVDERLSVVQRMANEGKFEHIISDFDACRDPKDNQFLTLHSITKPQLSLLATRTYLYCIRSKISLY